MTCERIRQLLALSPREWSEVDRLEAEAHLSSCQACAIIARAYAEQTRRLAALPRYSLSFGQQQAILNLIDRDAPRLRWSRLFSNALTVATGAVAFGFAIMLFIWLMGRAAPVSLTLVATQGLTPTSTLTPPSAAPPSPAPLPTVVLPNGEFAPPPPVTPEPIYATQYAAEQATFIADRTTAIARATASPFPAAGPIISLARQPSSAVVQRGGLSFEVHLPKDTYLAGERGQAEVAAMNAGVEPVFVRELNVVLLDAHGDEPAPWPWVPMSLPDMRGLGIGILAPGGIITRLLDFQIPFTPLDVVSNTYALWADMEFSRVLSAQGNSPDDIPLRTEAGPISINVIAPTAEQQIHTDLHLDWTGWQLRSIDANGQTPRGPLWGAIEALYPNGAMSGPLSPNAEGNWSGQWGDDRLAQNKESIIVRAWVAAPGYVSAAITQVLSADGVTPDFGHYLSAIGPITRSVFTSLAAAQAVTSFPLYGLTHSPAEATLENVVRVETRSGDGQLRTNVTQIYRLSNGAQLKLAQSHTIEDLDAVLWGEGRSTPESQAISIGANTGYVVKRFGYWWLDWTSDKNGFEMTTPVASVSLEELVDIAESVSPVD